jgi:hypothetical protein
MDTSTLNRMSRSRYWHNRGFAEGFDGFPPYPNVPEKFRAAYNANYEQGKRYAMNLERDKANGEFN